MKTNTIYVCDYCGKTYEKMSDAAECEKNCGVIAKKAEEHDNRRKAIEVEVTKLSNMLNEFYSDYGEVPSIHIQVTKTPTNNCCKVEKPKESNLKSRYFF